MAESTLKRKTTGPKKPKYKALPKAPSMSASLVVWERYKKRAAEIMKENLAKKAEYDKKRKAFETAKALRERIKRDAKNAFAKLRSKY